MEFETFEEISTKYPIDGKTNVYYQAHMVVTYVLTKEDLVLAKQRFPHGRYEEKESKWIGYEVLKQTWYDSYIYDGENWRLGEDSWDGYVPLNEDDIPHYGNLIFKTYEEAEKVCISRSGF